VSLQITLGYEDLNIEDDTIDYDYNDWVTTVDTRLQIETISQRLTRLEFTFIPQARGAIRSHIPHILFPANVFASDGVATLTIYDAAGDVLSSQQFDFRASQDNDFAILECTCDAFSPPGHIRNTFEEQPYEPTLRSSRLTIQFDSPGLFNPDFLDPARLRSPHGQGLFFDPYLVVLDHDLVIHRGDPRLLSIPDISYAWPEERVQLDQVYPLVEGSPPDFSFADDWWTEHNSCVYGDGIKCPLSPDMESYVPE
jgi:hypothetical protein